MPLPGLILISLIILLIAALPAWPYSVRFGYAPSGVLGLMVIVVLVSILLGWV